MLVSLAVGASRVYRGQAVCAGGRHQGWTLSRWLIKNLPTLDRSTVSLLWHATPCHNSETLARSPLTSG